MAMFIFRANSVLLFFCLQKESEKRNVTVQADDPISFMQLTAKNEMTSKEDQFQLSLLAAMGNTQRKEAADPLASKLNKVIYKKISCKSQLESFMFKLNDE